METPQSINRRTTRSQSKLLQSIPKPSPSASAAKSSAKGRSNRKALADVTNDSPIFGLAPGISKLEISPVPSNSVCGTPETVPRDGEDVLRSQVQSLLDQLGVAPAPAPLPRCAFNTTFEPSPSAFKMGPTPANTPADAIFPQPSDFEEMDKMTIRTLHFDSPGESSKSAGEAEDDEASNWSVAVNVSSPPRAESEVSSAMKPKEQQPDLWARRDTVKQAAGDSGYSSDDESEAFEDAEEEDEYDDCEEEEEYYEEVEDEEAYEEELCDGVSGMSVRAEKKPMMPEFEGKHIRFKYNSDGEMEGEEEVIKASEVESEVVSAPTSKHIRFTYNSDDEMEGEEVAEKRALSPTATKLKGVPTPAGKHTRFHDL